MGVDSLSENFMKAQHTYTAQESTIKPTHDGRESGKLTFVQTLQDFVLSIKDLQLLSTREGAKEMLL